MVASFKHLEEKIRFMAGFSWLDETGCRGRNPPNHLNSNQSAQSWMLKIKVFSFSGQQRIVLKPHQAPDCELPPTVLEVRYYQPRRSTQQCGCVCTPRGKRWLETRRLLSGPRWHTRSCQSPWRWWGDRGPLELWQIVTCETCNREPTVIIDASQFMSNAKVNKGQWARVLSYVYLLPGLLAHRVREGRRE